MRKPTRPLARRIDERQPVPYQQRSQEPVFCNEHERCQGCPYPRTASSAGTGVEAVCAQIWKKSKGEANDDASGSQ